MKVLEIIIGSGLAVIRAMNLAATAAGGDASEGQQGAG